MRNNTALRAAVASIALALGACGGGGDSAAPTPPPAGPPVSPGPPSSPQPPATPDPPSDPQPPGNPPASSITLYGPTQGITRQVKTTDPGLPASVSLEVGNLTGSDLIYVSGQYTTAAVQGVSVTLNGTQVMVAVTLRAPEQTAPGTYQDTITVRACHDSACTMQVIGSPVSIPVSYVVTNPSPAPAMTVDRLDISREGFVLDPGTGLSETVALAFSGLGTRILRPHLSVTSTNQTITALRQLTTSRTEGGLSIDLKSPATLGVGTHQDTITVRACLDATCANELEGSPATIQVQYTVTDTTDGPDGITARIVPVVANDLVWDAARQRFYVSIAQSSPQNPNTIGVLDPATATFIAYAPAGMQPGSLALSGDGQFLYVAGRGTSAIRRFALPSLALDLTIPLTGPASGNVPLYVREMQVSPDSAHTLGVVRTGSADSIGQAFDLVVYDDAVMRPQRIGEAGTLRFPSTFQWESGARIFAIDGHTTAGTMFQIAVDADGLSVTASQDGIALYDHEIYLRGGRLISQRGRVFDPIAMTKSGDLNLDQFGSALVAVDETSGRPFALDGAFLHAFDPQTLQSVGSVWMPRAATLLMNSRLRRWGPDGLALLNTRQGEPGILLIHGPFVRP